VSIIISSSLQIQGTLVLTRGRHYYESHASRRDCCLSSTTYARTTSTTLAGADTATSLQTKKQSNVNGALYSNEAGAVKSIFNRPSAVKAMNTDSIEQEKAAPGITIRVPC
jgi:hypothetical protein